MINLIQRDVRVPVRKEVMIVSATNYDYDEVQLSLFCFDLKRPYIENNQIYALTDYGRVQLNAEIYNLRVPYHATFRLYTDGWKVIPNSVSVSGNNF